jgi:hypothetical protein
VPFLFSDIIEELAASATSLGLSPPLLGLKGNSYESQKQDL